MVYAHNGYYSGKRFTCNVPSENFGWTEWVPQWEMFPYNVPPDSILPLNQTKYLNTSLVGWKIWAFGGTLKI